MKTLDVESLQSGIETAVNDTDQLTEQINTVQKAVRAFHSLDDALKGQGGEAIRAFYKDTHEPFLILLHQSFIDYKNRLEEMKEAVDTFEPNSSGYISQEYLENDVEDGFDKVEETAIEMTEDANGIIESVQDLVTVTKIDESDLVDEVTKGKEKAQEVVEELTILDDYQSSQLEETKQDIQMLRSFISELDGKFKSGDLSVRNYNVESIQDLTSYSAIQDSLNNLNSDETTTLDKDSIEDMPMYEIEKAKDASLDDLQDGGKEILNKAYNDLENGTIDRQDYLNILNGLQRFEENIENGEPEAEVSSDLLQYLNDNKGEVANNVADVGGKVTTHGMSAYGLYKAYDLHKKGFEIKSYTTKGGQKRYRVYNPEAIGISKPTKRDTKIYDRNYVNDQVRRKNGDNIRIADKVNVRAGAVGELKSKAGWFGVALDTGLNMKDNIQEGESASRIVGDAGVDVGIGAVSLAAAGVASAAVVGTLGAPVIAGAAVGFAASYAVSAISNLKIGDKKISDHVKDGVQSSIKTVAGWFK